MRAVIQRVSAAEVRVQGSTVARIGTGLLVLLCVMQDDDARDADRLAERIPRLRVFPDDAGRMNRSLLDAQGQILLVSQFTLAADLSRKGLRPSFDRAAAPDVASRLCQRFAETARATGVAVETGLFGAVMSVHLVNEGPVTFYLDSRSAELKAQS